MTFEQFQSTRTEIDDVRKAGRYGLDDTEKANPGYEYATGFYIEKVDADWPERCRAAGPCYLVLSNHEWIGELADLERILYDENQFELVDEPFAVAGATAGLV
jgi:hypothetical protein